MARNRTIPFGYRMEHGEIVLHTEEAACVQKAFHAYAEGKGFATVAEELQAMGVRYHPDSPLWNKHMVKRMLENERYTGQDGYPAIIPSEQFERATAVRTSKAATVAQRREPPVEQPPPTPIVENPVTDIRILRLESQIHQALSRPVLEPEKIKTMIFQCAAMKYDAIRNP